ncbi:hypothetical protein VP1G_10658 [Cytospora mali]|uniref:Carcinoembryonic antigen-related cell adhesion molecule 1 n=1 Tax=Cytospora mali TaxID=578113 RepID=A0A194URE8_CYTMA|nr:hypothetical protein VP1G_10658 [Valsa mali var. pyri (nom. inval.)]
MEQCAGTVFTYYGCDLMKDAGVQIIQPTPPATTSSSTSTTSSSSISSTSVSSVNSTAPASSSPAVSSAPVTSEHSSSSQVPIGAIVGGSIGGAAVVGLFVLGVMFIIHKQKRAAQQGDKYSARGSGDDFQRNTDNPGDWQQDPAFGGMTTDAGHMDHWHHQQPMAEAPQGDSNVPSSELSAIGRPSEMEGDLRKANHDRAELY